MSHPPEYQAKRYDNRARTLYAAANEDVIIDAIVDEATITLNLKSWQALGAALERPLMVGDVTRFAEENPAAVLRAAKRLASNPEWMARAKAGEAG
jgi:hypothetical protein